MKIEYAIILASATLALGYSPQPPPPPPHPKECVDLVCVNSNMDTFFKHAQDPEYADMNELAEDVVGNTTCSGSIDSQEITRFTGIFFGDFTTNGGQDSRGPLAVAGRFTASSYGVNTNHGSGDCSDLSTSFSSYGLVVGGDYNATDIQVHGAAFLPDGSDKSTVQVQTSGCGVYTKQETGIFSFYDAYTSATYIQKTYASYSPNYRLNRDDTLTQLGPLAAGFAVMTMDTCNEYDCPLYPGELSCPYSMFLGKGDWDGVKGGATFPNNLIINVPVDVGSTIVLRGDQPSKDLNACRTIWNFYPSNSNGEYTKGRFTIVRDTVGQFSGLILAPEANIIDGSTGNFAGLTIGNDYSWLNCGAGAELQDFRAAGGDCAGPLPCIILDPQVEKDAAVTTITAEDSTQTTDAASQATDADGTDGANGASQDTDADGAADTDHDHHHDGDDDHHHDDQEDEDCDEDDDHHHDGDDDHNHDDGWEDDEDCDEEYENDYEDEDCDDEYDDHDSHGKWKKRDEIPNEIPESLASNSNIAANGLKQPGEAEMNEGSVLRRGISLIVPAFVAYYLH